jgi:hypothetical protein
MTAFVEWCQESALSDFMRGAKWPFPTVEVFHFVGVILVFGSMLVLNLRIFGRILKHEPVPQVAEGVAPLTAMGLAAQVVSGPVLFVTSALKFSASPPFKLKLLLLVAALTYHFGVHRRFAMNPATPISTLRISAAISGLSWIGVVLAGLAISLLG